MVCNACGAVHAATQVCPARSFGALLADGVRLRARLGDGEPLARVRRSVQHLADIAGAQAARVVPGAAAAGAAAEPPPEQAVVAACGPLWRPRRGHTTLAKKGRSPPPSCCVPRSRGVRADACMHACMHAGG